MNVWTIHKEEGDWNVHNSNVGKQDQGKYKHGIGNGENRSVEIRRKNVCYTYIATDTLYKEREN